MNNKGFTLIEILTAFIILGILCGIGVISYNAIIDRVEINYYKTLENNLLLSANEYYNDNRGERPIDDYSAVSITDLVNAKYIDALMDKDNNPCTEGNVYIYKDKNNNFAYEACLSCGDYTTEGGNCPSNLGGVINIVATSGGESYNPLLTYTNTAWTNSDVSVTFSMQDEVDKYIITNTTNQTTLSCTSVSNNQCSINIDLGGSYKVVGYLNDTPIGNEKYFNIKIDRNHPSFEMDETMQFLINDENTDYDYQNLISKLSDDNGIKKVSYSLEKTGVNLNFHNLDDSFKISKRLDSGTYNLKVIAYDLANNTFEKSLTLSVDYNVKLLYSDGSIETLKVINGQSYGYYSSLPTTKNNLDIEWYYDGNKITNDTLVTLTSNHTLVAKNLTAPVCVFTGPNRNYIKSEGTAIYYLDCTHEETFNDSVITSSDFTLSSTGIVSVGSPSKTTITNGYRYTITVTGLSQGSTTLTLKAGSVNNIIGKSNESTTSSSVTVDTTIPLISSNLASGTYNTSKTITITSSDTNYSHMEIQVYKGGTSATGTLDSTKSNANVTAGTYSITLDVNNVWYVYAKAYDLAGNISNNGDWLVNNYTLDNTDPTISYSLASGTYNTSKTVTITANDTNYSHMEVKIYKGGTSTTGTLDSTKSNANVTTGTYSITLDVNNIWYIYTKAYDLAGNISNNNDWYVGNYTLNNLGPPVCVFTGPNRNYIKSEGTAIYYLDCTHEETFNDSVITSSDFTLSSTGIVSVGSPSKTTITNGYRYTITVTGLSQGSTTLTLKAGSVSDVLGESNESTTSSSITVDTIVPLISSNLASGAYNTSKTVTITSSDTNYSHMEIQVYKGGTNVTGTLDSTKSNADVITGTYSITLDVNNIWYIYAKAYDLAGNISNNGDWYVSNYTLDNTSPPVPTSNLRRIDSSGTVIDDDKWHNYTIWWGNFESTDLSGIKKYELSKNCTGSVTETIPSIAYTYGYTYSNNTNTEFCVRAVDNLNNVSDWSSPYYQKVDKTLPTITSPSNPLYAIKGSTTNLLGYASASDDLSELASFTANYANTSSLGLGTYTLTYTATDNAENTTSSSITMIVYEKILCDSFITESGNSNGLYRDPIDSTRCIYRGLNPNNYVRFNGTYSNNTSSGGTLYRIIGIESDGTIKMVHSSTIGNMAWHSSSSGLNYNTSTIRKYLTETYYNELNDIAKNQIQSKQFYIGQMNYYNSASYNITQTVTAEKTTLETNASTIGLMNVYDHLLASTNCSGTTTWAQISTKGSNGQFTCDTNNWLVYPTSGGAETWFITKYSDSRIRRWLALECTTSSCDSTNQGSIQYAASTGKKQIRPVTYLKDTVIIVGGSGTENDPYILSSNKFISNESSTTCTILTTPGYEENKVLTIVPSQTTGITYSFDNTNFNSTNSKPITSAGTYNGYIKDSDNKTNSCSIEISNRTEYRYRTRSVSYTAWTTQSSSITASCNAYNNTLARRTCTSYNVSQNFCLEETGSYTCYFNVYETRSANYGEWSSWSDWQTDVVTSSDAKEVETRTMIGY